MSVCEASEQTRAGEGTYEHVGVRVRTCFRVYTCETV